MPLLNNPRHERFVQALFEGRPASTAYTEAGYVPNDGNAIRLKGNERVQTRLAELQTAVAKNNEVTVGSLLAELEDARAKASDLSQLSAAVRAIEAKAKVSGLLTQKIEIGSPGSFDGCKSTADFADQMIEDLVIAFRPVDEQDRQGLIALLDRNMRELNEYIAAIKARPITAVRCNPTATANWRDLELHASALVDNPAQRRWDETKRQRQRRIINGNGQKRAP